MHSAGWCTPAACNIYVVAQLFHNTLVVSTTTCMWCSSSISHDAICLFRTLFAHLFGGQQASHSLCTRCHFPSSSSLSIPCISSFTPLSLPSPLFSQELDLLEDFRRLHTSNRAFSFCRYPFILDAGAKSRILQIDARRQMQDEIFRSLLMEQQSPYFVLPVRRDSVLQDTLLQV